MTRTAARELAIQLGFSVAAAKAVPEDALEEFFAPDHYTTMAPEGPLYEHKPGGQMDYIRQSVLGVSERREELDAYIAQYARGWRPERIDRAAAAILRQAMYEILYMPDIPPSSSIDEAVELAKGYEDADVVSFINGVLGGFYRAQIEGGEETAETAKVEAPETGAPDEERAE